MILVIDNYDSFVYNLVHYLEICGAEVLVYRNDDPRLDILDPTYLEALLISPGPCTPQEAGRCVELIRTWSGRLPILGVCLGHQCIAEAFGIRVVRAPEPVHGEAWTIWKAMDHPLLSGLSDPFPAGRYHSLVMDGELSDSPLAMMARTIDHIPMAVTHRSHPTFGVQFHPESILTPGGMTIIRNFLDLTRSFHEPRNRN